MEQINLNLIPNGILAVCHVSQYDNTGRKIRFHLFNGSDTYALSGTETITLRIRKTNGEILIFDIPNTASDYIELTVLQQMTDVSGVSVCEFRLTDSGLDIGSFNFKMKIEPDAFDGNLSISEVSGNIVTFKTDLAEDLIKLDVDLEPIQDLHGYDNPWPAGGGKNILPPSGSNSGNGLTTTPNDDGSFTVSGTATGTGGYITPVIVLAYEIPANTPIVISIKDAITASIRIFLNNPAQSTADISPGQKSTTATRTFAISAVRFYLSTTAGQSYNFRIYPQIEIGSTVTAWSPYSNICPITGHNSAQLFRTGKNLLDTRQESIPQYAGGSGVYANVTYTPNNDGSITINGTSTGASILFFNPVTLNPVTSYPFPTWKYTNNRYTLSVTNGWSLVTGDAYIQATVKKIKDDSIVSRQRLTASVFTQSFTVREDEYIADAFVRFSSGASASNINIKIQLEIDSTVTDYEPYTSDPTPIIVYFGQTVYKGKLYNEQRKVLVTHALFEKAVADMNNTEDFPGWQRFGIRDLVGSGVLGTFSTIGNVGASYSINTMGVNDILFLRKDLYKMTQSEWIAKNPDLIVQLMIELAEPFYIDLTQPVPAGINKLPFEDIIQDGWTNTISDVTATYSNGVVHVEGTNNSGNLANIVLFINAWADNPITLPAGTYIMSENLVIRCSIDGGDYANKSTSFTAESSVVVQGFYTSVKNGDTVDWEIPLMLINGTTRPTEYFPYYVTADPIRIPALVGTNNVYSDAGDVDVEYYTTLEGGND